jgi:D-amino-acid oxidase
MTTTGDADVLVIGAGVIGLTSAILIAQRGLRVRVVSYQKPLGTTSAAAGAIWGPYLAKDPRVLPWSLRTLSTLELLAKDAHSGIVLTNGIEASTELVATPGWMTQLPDFAHCEATALPAGYKMGWSFTVPIVDMPAHLEYLAQRLLDYGVKIEILSRPLSSLDGAGRPTIAIVNCAGLGAAALVGDNTLAPIWGQLVVLDNPGLTRFFADHGESAEPTYFMPQGDKVVLGGVIAPGIRRLKPDPAIMQGIVDRCAAVEPRLAGARVRGQRVGLRPARPTVRLEREQRPGGPPVIHNYGHGGSGVTLAWGCAADVLGFIEAG